MLNLRNVVKNLPILRKALEGSRTQLLRIVCDVILSTFTALVLLPYILLLLQMLSDERLTKIEALVCGSLNEECVPAKVCLYESVDM